MKRVSRIRKVIVAGLGTLLVSVSMTSCGFLRTLLEKAIESQNTPAQTEQDAEGASDNLPDQAAQGEAGDASGQTNEAQLPEVNTGAKSATIMIYLNGSDLESEGGSATDDLVEMINSGIGKRNSERRNHGHRSCDL